MSNPAMMQQAQQMMSNPAMQGQMAEQMKNMSADDLKNQMSQAEKQLPAAMAAAAPAAPVSVVAKLKASTMAVDDSIVEAVEEAENAKTLGNKKFKEGSWAPAAAKYTQGAEAVDKVLSKGSLSGADKKAVYELKEACHLNLANCRLKMSEWDAAIKECGIVLDKKGGASAAGAARKAHFRRGDAYVQLGQHEKARDDLKAAAKLDPSDTVVAGKLRDVLKHLGEEETDMLIEEVEDVDTSSRARGGSSSGAGPSMPAMPGMANMPDPAQMEAMLDQISPEQMEQQMSMLDNMDPKQLEAMGMPGMDKEQLKAAANMMKGMDKDAMKSMAKMAQQMRPQMEAMKAAGGGGGAGSSAGGANPLAGGLPGGFDPSNMDLDKGMDMMKNMDPNMMKAGMDMMKNMDPAMMKSMSKMMGREIDEGQLEQMQKMMSDMSPEDMTKWAGRAQSVAGFAQKPVAAYRSVKGLLTKLGAGGVFAILTGLLGVLMVGHVTDMF